MRIAILHSRVRVEERLLAESFQARGIAFDLLDVRQAVFDIHEPGGLTAYDAVLERCISQTQAVAVTRLFERFGIPCINAPAVIETCGDKLTTSLRLAESGVPTPRVRIALGGDSALHAVEQMGYPCVLKPAIGSWGRLLARVHDRDAAEAVIEHKETLGGPQHGIFYVQEFIDKPGRDLRVFMVGDEAIAGIVRESEHWITNTARGGRAGRFNISADLAAVCRSAARAVGGGILAIDLLETRGGEVLVSEVNHTMEFRNSIQPTGVDIPGRIADFVIAAAQANAETIHA